jgi:hypothetical protein
MKILLSAAVIAAAAFAAPSAYAMGGGWTPYWASPWYSPDGHSATTEGRSVSVASPPSLAGTSSTSGGTIGPIVTQRPSNKESTETRRQLMLARPSVSAPSAGRVRPAASTQGGADV